ncbi:MAG TPA: YIP1 family protein [Thermoanaerobaculia bacterium]|nr:YIP1 family protein [Thermoanaerobaculia bacterium]
MNESSETVAAADPADSPLARVAGVFGSPGPTFAAIARRPTWLLPVVISTVLAIAATAAIVPRLDLDSAVREAFAKRGITASEERIDQTIQAQKKFAGFFAYVWAFFAAAAVALVLATVFWLSFRAFGSEVVFRQSFGVTTHALLPYIGSTMLLILFVTRLDLVNPADIGDVAHTNLGFLVDRTANPALHSIAASIDVFTFWVLALLVIGFGYAAKVTRKKAAILILSLWGIFVLGKAGWAAVFH